MLLFIVSFEVRGTYNPGHIIFQRIATYAKAISPRAYIRVMSTYRKLQLDILGGLFTVVDTASKCSDKSPAACIKILHLLKEEKLGKESDLILTFPGPLEEFSCRVICIKSVAYSRILLDIVGPCCYKELVDRVVSVTRVMRIERALEMKVKEADRDVEELYEEAQYIPTLLVTIPFSHPLLTCIYHPLFVSPSLSACQMSE
jgi:hypothetical protein